MSERPKDGHRVGRASPWPVPIALGLVLSEVGILFGVVWLAVAGLVVFGGSCAGLLHETGIASRWRALIGVGGVLVLLGGLDALRQP